MTGIVEALTLVMADVSAVRKQERNSQQGFMFRGIDAVTKAVAPALRTHKIVVTPRVLEHTHGTVEMGQKRTPMSHVTVVVEYTFTATDGTALSCSVLGEAMDSGDKATPKAMSVAFRTALLQALCLPTDDPDPDASSYTRPATSRDVVLAHHQGDYQAALDGAAQHGLTLPADLDAYARLIERTQS